MRILLNDIIQYSDEQDTLKSPALSGITDITGTLNITLDRVRKINAIGIGNTDGTTFIVNGQAFNFTENGLYLINQITTDTLTITTNGTSVGRIAAGVGIDIPTSVRKEPSFNSTASPRMTLSGQVIHGAGGYNYRMLSLDSRYKFDSFAMTELEEGYKFIAKGYPFFIDLADESYKLPFDKFYGIDTNQQNMSFESGIRRFLYSRRWEFRECF